MGKRDSWSAGPCFAGYDLSSHLSRDRYRFGERGSEWSKYRPVWGVSKRCPIQPISPAATVLQINNIETLISSLTFFISGSADFLLVKACRLTIDPNSSKEKKSLIRRFRVLTWIKRYNQNSAGDADFSLSRRLRHIKTDRGQGSRWNPFMKSRTLIARARSMEKSRRASFKVSRVSDRLKIWVIPAETAKKDEKISKKTGGWRWAWSYVGHNIRISSVRIAKRWLEQTCSLRGYLRASRVSGNGSDVWKSWGCFTASLDGSQSNPTYQLVRQYR